MTEITSSRLSGLPINRSVKTLAIGRSHVNFRCLFGQYGITFKEDELCNKTREGGALIVARRIVIEGVRKRTINSQELAYAYFLMGKSLVRKRREREAEEKAKRASRGQTPGKDGTR